MKMLGNRAKYREEGLGYGFVQASRQFTSVVIPGTVRYIGQQGGGVWSFDDKNAPFGGSEVLGNTHLQGVAGMILWVKFSPLGQGC